jgi:hypothetical protein
MHLDGFDHAVERLVGAGVRHGHASHPKLPIRSVSARTHHPIDFDVSKGDTNLLNFRE